MFLMHPGGGATPKPSQLGYKWGSLQERIFFSFLPSSEDGAPTPVGRLLRYMAQASAVTQKACPPEVTREEWKQTPQPSELQAPGSWAFPRQTQGKCPQMYGAA